MGWAWIGDEEMEESHLVSVVYSKVQFERINSKHSRAPLYRSFESIHEVPCSGAIEIDARKKRWRLVFQE